MALYCICANQIECYSLQSYEFALTTQNLQNFLGYLTKDWRGVLSDLGL